MWFTRFFFVLEFGIRVPEGYEKFLLFVAEWLIVVAFEVCGYVFV